MATDSWTAWWTAGSAWGCTSSGFQRNINFVRDILGLAEWLGDVNFGGVEDPGRGDPPAIQLMSLIAGGFYAVRPKGEPSPEVGLF